MGEKKKSKKTADVLENAVEVKEENIEAATDTAATEDFDIMDEPAPVEEDMASIDDMEAVPAEEEAVPSEEIPAEPEQPLDKKAAKAVKKILRKEKKKKVIDEAKEEAEEIKDQVKKRKFGLRAKTVIAYTVLIYIVVCILSLVLLSQSRTQTYDILCRDIAIITEAEGENISTEIDYYMGVVEQIGCNPEFSAKGVTPEQQIAILERKVEECGFASGRMIVPATVENSSGELVERAIDITETGFAYDQQIDYSTRDYYTKCMAGEMYRSEAIKRLSSGGYSLTIAAPVWKDGIKGGTACGSISFVLSDSFFERVLESLKVSDTTIASIVNQTGLIMASVNEEYVITATGLDWIELKDADYIKFAADTMDATNTETTTAVVKIGGVTHFASSTPIPDTPGWKIVTTTSIADYQGNFNKLTLFAIIVGTIAATAMAIFVGQNTRKILRPIEECVKRIKLLATGDLRSPVLQFKTKDETQDLCEATEQIATSVKNIIDDIDFCFEGISHGELDIHVKNRHLYVKDYEPLLTGLRKLKFNLNDIMLQINTASEQVNSGAEQVSSGAQALSQGATQQASSVQELSATINLIAEQIRDNDESAQKANALADKTGEAMLSSSDQMKAMVNAMEEIKDTASQIEKIVKTIDDIAFQTNILALNAAVEAARAGAAGRGFAVVADEVRNLAQKSSEAANNTTTLIETTINAVKHGAEMADEAAQSIFKVTEYSEEVAKIVASIATASQEQAIAVSQVNTGMEQVSAVVQTNSATAEESAAASEELSGQANMLKNLVDHFSLINADIVDRWRTNDKTYTPSFEEESQNSKY